MWIMIAGPYRSGTTSDTDRQDNLATLNRLAYEVFLKGHVPIIGVNMALPIIEAAGQETYNALMMPLSLALAERCDAILRLDAPSHGADQEVHRILHNGGTLYQTLDEIPDASI
jgi:hypothetical protein